MISHVDALRNESSNPYPTMALDNYLDCREYRDKPRSEQFPDFTIFQHTNQQYYFARVDADGEVQLVSQGYASVKTRDTGIQSVINNYDQEDRYQRGTTADGRHYLALRAGNNQEVARTCPSSDRNAASRMLPSARKAGSGSTTPAAPTTSSTSPVGVALGAVDGGAASTSTGDASKDAASDSGSDSKRNVDEYLDCERYRNQPELEPGVTGFEHEGQYYFAFVRENGSVRLRSEGYPNTGARETGIRAVRKHLDDRDRYQTRQSRGGRWYLSLTAANNQEIARTCTAGSRAEALEALPATGSKEQSPAQPAAPTTSSTSPVGVALGATDGGSTEMKAAPATARNNNIDEYLPCEAYKGAPDEGSTDLRTFRHDDGEYYFAILNEDGSVRLRSEGYPNSGARKTGIAAVRKHYDNHDRYQLRQTKKGRWYLMLTATNNQEIARTCTFATREEARAVRPPKPAPAPEPAPLAAAAPVVAAAAKSSNRNVDEYLPCDAYKGEPDEGTTDLRTFRHDGEYYFAILNEDGSVRLRSEGYPNGGARKTGLASVRKHMDDDKQYKLRQSRKGKWYLILLASNNQEIARTCEQKDRAAAKALRPGAFAKPPKKEKSGAAGAAAAALGAAALGAAAVQPEPVAAVPPPAPEPEPVAAVPKTPAEREDDYLPCKQYANRKINDKRNNVAFFKHKNGQYYFAIYHKNGRVRLRSEGFETAKGRDQELSGALRHLDNEEFYTEYRKKGYTIRILHDETGREVGRSCAEKDKAAAVVPPVAAAAATAAAAVVAAPVVTAAATPPPPPPPPPRKAAPAPPPPAATKKGGFPWWLLALLALLLILLLFWCGGCGDALGCGGAAVGDDDAPTTEVVTPPADVDAAAGEIEADAAAAAAAAAAQAEAQAAADRAAAEAAAAANATCNCDAQTHPTFDLPNGGSAKVLTRLGTNPEFGDSHSLSPAQFFQKLQRRYNASSVDKRYLDGVYRAMGYPNGFAAASADQFSSTKLRRGQRGNMGYGANHGTVYAQIDVSDRDLQAFKLEAANGCDLHFMKTCGNHFFFCPN